MAKRRSKRSQAAKLKTPPQLKVSFSNVRGLRTNFDEVSRFLQTRSPDLLALSETKLDAGVSSADRRSPLSVKFERIIKFLLNSLVIDFQSVCLYSGRSTQTLHNVV